MNSALRARIATALLLAAIVIVVLVFLPPAVAAVLISLAIFAAGWEWAAFARITSIAGRLTYAAGIVLLLAGAEILARDPRLLELMLRAAALWWLVAFAWLALRAEAGGRVAAAAVGFLVLVPAGLGLEHLVELQPRGQLLLLFLLVLIAAADVGAYFGGRR
jgi:phosphatidate cytidylyltransferase